mgnify:CR=1 FL=1
MEQVMNILCNGSKSIIESYNTDKPTVFRKKIKKQEDVDKAVRIYITLLIRNVMIYVIGLITKKMKPMGDMIIAGTGAFNHYLPDDVKTPTTDIDTKFVPEFVEKGKIVHSRSNRYFEYLQITKLILWEFLHSICKDTDKLIVKALKTGRDAHFEYMVGLSPITKPHVTRRYTYIPKKRQNYTKSIPSENNVLVDIELFALDMQMSYVNIKTHKIESNPFNGILDIAFMRRDEFGWDVIKDKNFGIKYTNPVTGKPTFNKHIMIASPRFLLEDVYDMIKLGIRKKKQQKDIEKLKLFVKHVFNINSDSPNINTLYKKAMDTVKKHRNTSKRPPFIYKKYLGEARNVQPFNNDNRTSQTTNSASVMRKFLIGLQAPKGMILKNFTRTSGNSRFNLNKRKWVTNNKNNYIKNETLYRPTKKYENTLKWKNRELHTRLINYNPYRNYKMDPEIKFTSAYIPLTGLRD